MPGDLICAVCSAGNSPERRFCRRCGNSLATAVVAVKPPWYRRIFGRNRRAAAAGYRPGSMGRAGQPRPSRVKRVFFIVLLLVIVLPIVGYFTVQPVRVAIDRMLRDASIGFTLWRNPSSNAFDEDVATFWLANPASGVPALTVTFRADTNLAGLTFHSGAPGADYQTHARPRQVELVFLGETQTEVLELRDDPGPQEVCLDRIHPLRQLDIRILSVYEPVQSGRALVALREVGFKSGNCP